MSQQDKLQINDMDYGTVKGVVQHFSILSENNCQVPKEYLRLKDAFTVFTA